MDRRQFVQTVSRTPACLRRRVDGPDRDATLRIQMSSGGGVGVRSGEGWRRAGAERRPAPRVSAEIFAIGFGVGELKLGGCSAFLDEFRSSPICLDERFDYWVSRCDGVWGYLGVEGF